MSTETEHSKEHQAVPSALSAELKVPFQANYVLYTNLYLEVLKWIFNMAATNLESLTSNKKKCCHQHFQSMFPRTLVIKKAGIVLTVVIFLLLQTKLLNF